MPDDVSKPPDASVPNDARSTGKSSRKLTLILSAVLLLAGGGAAAWYLGVLPVGSSERHADATAAVEQENSHGGGGRGDRHGAGGHGGTGAILSLDTFIASLADYGGKRYLKTTVNVEFLGESVPPGIDARLPQIRDLLLTLLTSKTFDDIRTAEGKQELREEIVASLNRAVDPDAVKAVYFTEFIVQ